MASVCVWWYCKRRRFKWLVAVYEGGGVCVCVREGGVGSQYDVGVVFTGAGEAADKCSH